MEILPFFIDSTIIATAMASLCASTGFSRWRIKNKQCLKFSGTSMISKVKWKTEISCCPCRGASSPCRNVGISGLIGKKVAKATTWYNPITEQTMYLDPASLPYEIFFAVMVR
ncbi:MAG TPA: hypothetical protein EYP35_03075 [Desulfobacterales bacterium]|nr:hypothetical protein [Desulfobacterales bacterium]